MISQMHHYFLLPLSSWALLSSMNSFSILFSFIIFIKFNFLNNLMLSLMTVVFSSMYWWILYSAEFSSKGASSTSLETGIKIAMLLFISSEVLFFFSFFWSYFHFFCSPMLEVGASWPPILTTAFDCFKVPMINTTILLISGVSVTVSHMYLNMGKAQNFNSFLLITVVLGLIFTLLQCMEYQSSFFSINDSTFGTAFFVLTGFHGIHVLIGTLFLAVALSKGMTATSSESSFLSFELASWYWHFVDVVWIFLYFFLYYMNS